jgi:hypothetical protein
MSLGSVRASLALILVFAAGCSGPGAPTIPEREQIGPPEAAGDHCPRKVVPRFGQAYFHVADLDLGRTCIGFVEQDECVVALFRDCTDQVAETPRSWQGTIDDTGRIHLERTNETTATVIPRAPTECNGTLQTEQEGRIRTWAKLDCHITQGTHGGFYFEKVENPAEPYVRLDEREIELLANPGDEDVITDFAVLGQRNQIWALVDAANAIGLYTGATTAAQLSRSSLALDKPIRLIVDDAETTAIVADVRNVHRLDPVTMTVTSTREASDIRAAELTSAGVLLALASGQNRTTLRFRHPITLAPLGPAPLTIDGRVKRIVPLFEEGTRAVALLTFDTVSVKLFDAQLMEPMTPDALPAIPDEAVSITGEQKVVFSALEGGALFSMRISDGFAPVKVLLPLTNVEDMMWHEQERILLVSTRENQLYPFDVEAERPLLQAVVPLETEISLLRTDASGRLYGLFGDEGVIRALLR